MGTAITAAVLAVIVGVAVRKMKRRAGNLCSADATAQSAEGAGTKYKLYTINCIQIS